LQIAAIGNPQNSMISKTSASAAHPAVTVIEINDPTEANAGFELLDLDAVHLQSLPLRARRVIVRLDSATVVFHAVNTRVRTRTSALQGMLAYVAFGPRTSGKVNGLPVRPGLMLAVGPGTEINFVTNVGWESITFLIRPGDLLAHLVARQRGGEFHTPRGAELMQLEAQRIDALYAWGKRLVDAASRRPERFATQAKERNAVRNELLESLLATLRVAGELRSTRSDRTRMRQSHIVRIAEDYAMSQCGDRLHVTDLCKVAAVSERKLEYAFKEVMGLTPVAYLNRLRLHRVRQALLVARPGTTTVSTEALNWGFWHLGEFSRAYRDCFGELPSVTLRRKP